MVYETSRRTTSVESMSSINEEVNIKSRVIESFKILNSSHKPDKGTLGSYLYSNDKLLEFYYLSINLENLIPTGSETINCKLQNQLKNSTLMMHFDRNPMENQM